MYNPLDKRTMFQLSKRGFDVYYDTRIKEWVIWDDVFMRYVNLPDGSKQSVDEFLKKLED